VGPDPTGGGTSLPGIECVSASLMRGAAYAERPFEILRAARDEAPLLWDDSRAAWIVTRYDDVLDVLRDNVKFSNRVKQRTLGIVFGQAGTMSSMDGKDHVDRRKIIAPELMGRRLGDFLPLIEANARGLVDEFSGRGRVDLLGEFATRLPLRVMIDMLGFPKDDEVRLRNWHNRMFWALGSTGDALREGIEAHEELAHYAEPLIVDRTACSREDLVSKIIHSQVADHQQGVEEMQGLVSQVLTAGSETTARAIASMWFNLLSSPGQLEMLEDDPSLWDHAFSETLRHDPPIPENLREVVEVVEIHGRRLWPGEAIYVSLLSANHDEKVFKDPERFDIHRPDLRFARELRLAGLDEGGRSGHLAFGAGSHFCIGFELARAEATIASKVLLETLRSPRLASDRRPILTPASRLAAMDSLVVEFDAR
jgi:cytochrome P450